MVGLHGGRIECVSRVSEGAEFSFSIPVDSRNIIENEDVLIRGATTLPFIGIMTSEMESQHAQNIRCDKERSLEVLAIFRAMEEKLTIRTCVVYHNGEEEDE